MKLIRFWDIDKVNRKKVKRRNNKIDFLCKNIIFRHWNFSFYYYFVNQPPILQFYRDIFILSSISEFPSKNM